MRLCSDLTIVLVVVAVLALTGYRNTVQTTTLSISSSLCHGHWSEGMFIHGTFPCAVVHGSIDLLFSCILACFGSLPMLLVLLIAWKPKSHGCLAVRYSSPQCFSQRPLRYLVWTLPPIRSGFFSNCRLPVFLRSDQDCVGYRAPLPCFILTRLDFFHVCLMAIQEHETSLAGSTTTSSG